VIRTAENWSVRATLGIATVLIVPPAEELLFRGILYPWIKRTGHPQTALWVTSAAFAAIHMNAPTFVPLLVLALVLTWLYEKTGNLLAPIVAHSCFNGLNFALLYMLPLLRQKFPSVP